jgi:diaminopimelate decarboxylase
MALVRDASGVLLLGGVNLAEVAGQLGTPTYVYDLDAIETGARELDDAFEGAPHLIAYAVKANSAGGVVRALAAAGCGADIVSGAELRVAVACGVSPDRVIYSGVAKTDDELDLAIASGPRGIGAVQVESSEEIARLEARARAAGRKARAGIRINPSVDLRGSTHANIATGHDTAKFGIARVDLPRAVQLFESSPHLVLVGIGAHAGSQCTSTAQYGETARTLFGVVRSLRGDGALRSLAFVSTGGGFGIDYTGERGDLPRPRDFVATARSEQRAAQLDDFALYIEPGRSLVGPHGVLLARVIQSKMSAAARWIMIDAGMNDLLRPALYQAKHRVVPLEVPAQSAQGADARSSIPWRVVGPVCESSDDFGEHPLPVQPVRAVALLDAGAYGYVMASEYNGRRVPVEAFVRGGRVVSATPRATAEEWATARAAAGA